jgi:Domain of unknown function (DUF4249)
MRRLLLYNTFPFILCTTIYISCKKSYNPAATQVNYKFLVVDGVIVNSIDSPTAIRLSRTVRLTDSTTASSPETGATVSVEGKTGEHFLFTEAPGGVYISVPLILNYSNQYRLKITTANGSQYQSDYVTVSQTPAIDSVTWQQQNDVTINVNTHDPANNTKYYRWDFVETWEYTSTYNRTIAESNGLIYYIDSTNQTYDCWSNDNSTDILLGSTVALSQNVISQEPIALIPQNSDKIGVRYSILVKQYGLTEDAFQYFQILKKNTENLGSIFDAQPTQLSGNIHSITNPSEIVIGFITASSVQEERIFINNNQLSSWVPVDNGQSCDLINILQNPTNYLLYSYPDTAYAPYYFTTSPTGINLVKRSCVDCTTRGGTTTKPSYWQ